MKISIAMATYNGAQYIQEQLQSFADQTRQPDELIITDDCSTDQTEIIVQDFAKTAPFKVEFHRNEKNLGYCGNFNAALMKTTGDWVFLSDQDDVWFPGKIEHMIGVIEQNAEAQVVMNDAEVTDVNLLSKKFSKYSSMKKAGLNDSSYVMGCCAAFKREFLNLFLPIPEKFSGHDNFLVGISDKLGVKVISDVSLQYYRRHGDNTSNQILNEVSLSRPAFFIQKNFHLFTKIDSSYDGVLRALSDNKLNILAMRQALCQVNNIDIKNNLNLAINDCILMEWHLNTRLEIISLPWYSKVFMGLKYYSSGGYSNSLGFRSLVKDIFSKRYQH